MATPGETVAFNADDSPDALKENDALKVEIASLKDKLKKQAPQLVQAQSKAKKEAERAEKSTKELKELKEKCQKQAAQNVRLKSKVTTLEQQLSTAATAPPPQVSASAGGGNEELAMELERSRVKIENLEKECKFLTGKIQEAGKWGQSLIDQNDELQKKIKDLQSDTSSASTAKASFNESMRTLEDMVKNLERENEELRSNMGTKGTAKRPLLARGITEALAQNDDLCGQLSRAEVENNDLRNQIEILEQTVQRLAPDGSAGGSLEGGRRKMDAKAAFHMVFGGVQKRRLQRMLADEEDRARELQIELQTVRQEKSQQDSHQKQLREQFAELTNYARKQEEEARGAQLVAQNLQLKLETMDQAMRRMQIGADDTEEDSDHRRAQLHAAGMMANNLLQDLKAGLDDSLIDDINFLTADSSDEESMSDDEDYDGRIRELGDGESPEAEGEGSGASKGLDGKEKPKSSAKSSKKDGAADGVAEVGRADAPKALKPAKSTVFTKREKEVVKLTLNETHKKLLQAMRLVELLTNANAKLEEELNHLETKAIKKMKRLQFMTGIIVASLPVILCVGFLLFIIMKVNCGD